MQVNRESLAGFVTACGTLSGYAQAELAKAAGATPGLVAQWRAGSPVTDRREPAAVTAVGYLFAARLRALALGIRGMGSAELLRQRAAIAGAVVPALIELADACTETMRAGADAKARDAALAARASEFVLDLDPVDLAPTVTAEYRDQAARGTGPVFDFVGGQAVPRAAQL